MYLKIQYLLSSALTEVEFTEVGSSGWMDWSIPDVIEAVGVDWRSWSDEITSLD